MVEEVAPPSDIFLPQFLPAFPLPSIHQRFFNQTSAKLCHLVLKIQVYFECLDMYTFIITYSAFVFSEPDDGILSKTFVNNKTMMNHFSCSTFNVNPVNFFSNCN